MGFFWMITIVLSFSLLTLTGCVGGDSTVSPSRDCVEADENVTFTCEATKDGNILWYRIRVGLHERVAVDSSSLADYSVAFDGTNKVSKLTLLNMTDDADGDVYYCEVQGAPSNNATLWKLDTECSWCDPANFNIFDYTKIDEKQLNNDPGGCGGLSDSELIETLQLQLSLPGHSQQFEVKITASEQTIAGEPLNCMESATPINRDILTSSGQTLTIGIEILLGGLEGKKYYPISNCSIPGSTTTEPTKESTTTVADNSNITDESNITDHHLTTITDITGTASDATSASSTDGSGNNTSTESDPLSPEGSGSSTPKGSEVSSPEGQDPTEETSSTAEPSGGTDWKLIIVLSVTLGVTITGAIICMVVLMLRNEQKTIKLY